MASYMTANLRSFYCHILSGEIQCLILKLTSRVESCAPCCRHDDASLTSLSILSWRSRPLNLKMNTTITYYYYSNLRFIFVSIKLTHIVYLLVTSSYTINIWLTFMTRGRELETNVLCAVARLPGAAHRALPWLRVRGARLVNGVTWS